MKVSLNWLKEYIDLEFSNDKIADILTEIGLEVEGFEVVENIRGSLKDLVVGRVIECGKHPNADRLSLTKVSVGKDTDLQIVCGAPNVAAGQKVVVAPIGTTLFSKEGESWKIKKGKIRGEVSEGMICAEDEIGLGEDHSGILVLPEEYEVGELLTKYFETGSDVIFEIGLTPNRSDATCHLGVARDLGAALKVNYEHSGIIRKPGVEEFAVDNHDHEIEVEVLAPEGCPRYAGVIISGIKVEESPAWLKQRLQSIGVRAINNIVDITNFVLHELGQPLHAFDLEKIGGRKIKVQTLPEGTPFLSLDEQERKLRSNDLMICDGLDVGMCIAGVFGGINSGVTDDTTSIFLESAHFNAQWIRRTSTGHLLFTDAAKVFEKGSDPNVCVHALKRAALMIKEIAGGDISSRVIDVYPEEIEPVSITLSFSHLNRIVGTSIATEEVLNIVEALEMSIVSQDDDTLTVQVPTNKADVKREADLIEEILRIYGFNKVPIPERMCFSVAKSPTPDTMQLRNRVADLLCSYGLHEIMGLSMLDRKYVDNVAFTLNDANVVRINNTSNVQVELMRPNLIITALETVLYNQNRQQNNLRLFEFGKSYLIQDGKYHEKEHLTITISGWSEESWLHPTLSSKNEYFVLKSLVSNVLVHLGIATLESKELEGDPYFAQGIAYKNGDREIIKLGEIKESLLKGMELRNKVFIADFDWRALLASQAVDQVVVQEPSRYPEVRRDLALIVDKAVTFQKIEETVRESIGTYAKAINLFDVFEKTSVIGEGKKSYAISIVMSNPKKTFSEKELEKLMNNTVNNLQSKIGAKLR